uniref:Uncharacterized protein n=1 Tax=Aegilops tauschii subsp. strangulata TaxID=200361 RepID=A0A453IK12_AEGTS
FRGAATDISRFEGVLRGASALLAPLLVLQSFALRSRRLGLSAQSSSILRPRSEQLTKLLAVLLRGQIYVD